MENKLRNFSVKLVDSGDSKAYNAAKVAWRRETLVQI